jgi:hypothetical protein
MIMARTREVRAYIISGKTLSCPICQHTAFWTRQTLMNTTGMTFFGIEWSNRKATNYVCDNCGHVLWFMK